MGGRALGRPGLVLDAGHQRHDAARHRPVFGDANFDATPHDEHVHHRLAVDRGPPEIDFQPAHDGQEIRAAKGTRVVAA